MEWEGRVAEFYEDSLGLYPYFSPEGQPVNGGLPQHTSLERHLQKVEEDLTTSLPQAGAPGLGVLRWKEWDPQWSRNRGTQRKYLETSRALLRGFFPNWSEDNVEKWAQVDFEAAAQFILLETLTELKRLRPQRLWGMAPYPSCYNSDPTQLQLANYTGHCPAAEMALNDELMWLWKQSDALYPILALENLPEVTKGTWLYASNQIREALRVAALAGTTFELPVFPLIKTMYTSSSSFLSEKLCSDLTSYVREVLGPYAVNITMATRLCSMSLCNGLGRCVRKKSEDPVYLHLPPAHFLLLRRGEESIRSTGQLPPSYVDGWKRNFYCHWFEAMEGATTDQESVGIESGGQRSLPTTKPFNIVVHTVGSGGHRKRIEKTLDRSNEAVSPMMPAGQEQAKSVSPIQSVTILLLCLSSFSCIINL
ncbi:Hyaluronidase-4 [Bagarius yarrelli]|uniref:Hyaluronidase n=1 Tax=Bagarius yarrelli TaxID=175774 RepID=A0A556UFZ4_BAGYA|nr:Hyaluronidase-4 [Bagarius yarrelli]